MISHRNRRGAACLLLLVTLIRTPSATADDGVDAAAPVPTVGVDPGLARNAGSDAASGAPPLTIRTSTSNWEMGFHGYLRAPMRLSFDDHPVERYVMDGARPRRTADGSNMLADTGERDWEVHAPPATVDANYTRWTFTNNLPNQWTEMIFSYGNAIAVGNVGIAAWNLTDSSWRNPNAQLGIDRAWVTLNFPRAFGKLGGLKWDAGVFGNRYGTAGRYDAGRYDTYLFGRTHVAGETLTARFDLTDGITLVLEHGFGAKADTLRGDPQYDLAPGRKQDDNSMSWIPWAGKGQYPALIHHAHAGLLFHDQRLWEELWINAHFMHAFTNSAHASDDPDLFRSRERDGKYIIAGGEVKLNGAAFGDLYLGFSTVETDGLGRMPDAIELLHSLGGADYANNFFGDQFLGTAPDDDSRDGELNPCTGRVNTVAWQYTLSLARLIWFLQEKRFWGQGPDLQLSFFGMLNLVSVDADLKPYLKRVVDKKLKLGADVMYNPIRFFGLGVRFDHVRPDLGFDPDDPQNDTALATYTPFSVVSPTIRFKTAFVTHEELNIGYSRYFWSGDRRAVRAEGPHKGIPADRHAVMLSVNMWW